VTVGRQFARAYTPVVRRIAHRSSRADADVELLEPLPVDEPESRRGVVAAIVATIDQATLVRSLPPYTETPVADPPPMRAGAFLAAFSRMFALAPDRLASLDEWYAAHAEHDRLPVTRRLVLGPPRAEGAGGWRVPARLRSPGRFRSIPVEIVLWPRLDAWTKLNVEPQRGVRVGRRYFRSGHRALDVLCDRLVRELRSVS
jgi:hypothetical protein